MGKDIKVSVIIPIYNVGAYIARCAETLMQQTLKEGVEYIFVNDATKDDSITVLQSVLKKYPLRTEQIKVVSHKQNLGLPAARNTGLALAKGEYIYHCDSDDYIELEMLECLYNEAVKNKADIVWCDYSELYPHYERSKKQPSFDSPMEAIKGMLTGKMEYNVWNKLVKHDLYTKNNIGFPSGYPMGEDLTMIMLFANSQRIMHIPMALYHYDKTNPGALTSSSMSEEKKRSLQYNVRRIENYLHEKKGDSLNLELASLKLNLKWPFLISSPNFNMYKEWNGWFPESNKYIKNQSVSCRIKMLEQCAERKLYWIIWLHYWLVIRLFYKVCGK